MSRRRTRPDTSGQPSYITAEGYRTLELEAERLWMVERSKVAKAVAVAAAEGDRSENAEYIYSKKKLAEIDRRLKFLGKRLDVLTVVRDKPANDGRVYFGCWVCVADETRKESVYRIVGPDETSSHPLAISVESPMAKALLGREPGDEVQVHRPKGTAVFEIVEVFVDVPTQSEESR